MSRVYLVVVATLALFAAQASAIECKMDPPLAKIDAKKYLDCDGSEYKTFGSQQIQSFKLRLSSVNDGVESTHTVTFENLPASMNRLVNYGTTDYFNSPLIQDRIKKSLPAGVKYKIDGITSFTTAGEELMTKRPRGGVTGGAPAPKLPPYNPDAAGATN